MALGWDGIGMGFLLLFFFLWFSNTTKTKNHRIFLIIDILGSPMEFWERSISGAEQAFAAT